MSHPLEPKRRHDINEDLASMMEADLSCKSHQKLVEPGRKDYALEPGPETTVLNIDELARADCPTCRGRGVIPVGAAMKNAPLYNIPCSCAERGYQRLMSKRVALPCRFCGQTGWCNHRPRTLAQLVAEQIRANVKDRAAFMPQGETNGTQSIDGGGCQNSGLHAGSQVPSRRPDPRRQDLLPGLQPGDEDPDS